MVCKLIKRCLKQELINIINEKLLRRKSFDLFCILRNKGGILRYLIESTRFINK